MDVQTDLRLWFSRATKTKLFCDKTQLYKPVYCIKKVMLEQYLTNRIRFLPDSGSVVV